MQSLLMTTALNYLFPWMKASIPLHLICRWYYWVGIIGIVVCWFLESKFPHFYFLMNHGKVLATSNYSLRVHKSKFWHFYIVALIVFPLLLAKITLLDAVVFAHLLRRLVESLWLFDYSATSYMHVVHYLVGITYYPVLLLGLQPIQSDNYIIRAALFSVFSLLQLKCHWTLAMLKSKAHKRQFVPNEGMFAYVWCPHYLLEILMYATIAMNKELALNFLFTFLNLSVSACKTKRWIERTNPKAPRKPAIIPFIL